MKLTSVVGVLCLQLLASVSLNAQALRQNDLAPLKNWAAPLYWQPNQTERGSLPPKRRPDPVFPHATSNTALIFVAVSPCRMVDTRGASAGFIGSTPFNGPLHPGRGTATFPVQSASETATTAPSPCGAIPSIAQAYSLNLTIVPHPLGTPVNYVTMWPAGVTIPQVSTLNDQPGTVAANAAIVPAGSPNGGINVFAYGATDVIIDMNGFYAAPSDLNGNTAVGTGTLLGNTTGADNTAIGVQALVSNTAGSANTANGFNALYFNTTGNDNTASGYGAMGLNTTGAENTASGYKTLFSNTTGSSNTATGSAALSYSTSGVENTANGANALYSNTTGGGNTASGYQSLFSNTTGSENTATGHDALDLTILALATPLSAFTR